MELVTELVQRYRLALRELWNNHIWIDPSQRDNDAVDRLESLKRPLFAALVGNRIEGWSGSNDELFGEQFRVVAHPHGIGTTIPSIYIDIGFPNQEGHCWKHIVGPFADGEISLTLIDLCDWTSFGYMDLHFYMTRIERCDRFPEYRGRHALVEVTSAEVTWN